MVVGGPAQGWGNGNSALEQANPQWPLSFWLTVGQSLPLHIWKGFVPKQNRQKCFKSLLILTEETISYELNPEQ